MSKLNRPFRSSPLALALLAALAGASAQAATILVDPTAVDEPLAIMGTRDGKCSLREAVNSVNAGADLGDCVATVTEPYGTNDTITLPAGAYRLTLTGLDESASGTGETAVVVNAPNADMGDLDLLKSVRIIGAGSGTTTIDWDPAATDASGADRIFHIYTTDTLTTNVNVLIQGVTLSGGKTFQVDLGAHSTDTTLHYYLRRAGGALALGAAANVVAIDSDVTGTDNAANGGGRGGSTGEETAVAYTLALSDVVVDSNSAQGDGGGLYIAAQTTATNVVIKDNISTTNGGGLYNEANTTLTTSTLSGNNAEGGGGLFATGSNTVNISRSTLSGNQAIGGGAMSSRAGVTVHMVNTTVSGNTGLDVGAGVYTNGIVNLNFVTIAKNIASADSPNAGSGINIFPAGAATITLKNVLLQGNLTGSDPLNRTSANCGRTGSGGTVTSQGHNLSSDASCNTSPILWLTDTTDQNNVDPKIDLLALNAPGQTQTHALLAGSPALGAGLATAGVTVDQRGITRDATPDIGAYEVPTPPSSGGGGGGCTANPAAEFEPGLLGLLAAALGSLWLRRRRPLATRR